MEIRVSVKRKFTVKGRTFNSIEEMPSDIREAFEKARGTSHVSMARIVFNGHEYSSVEAMPPDVRQVYDKLMKAAETGEISADVLSEAEVGTTAPVQRGIGVGSSGNTPRPIEPESILSLSPRMLIVGLGLLIFLLGLYFGIIR